MVKTVFAITVKDFVEKLTAGGGENPSPADCVEYGVQHGWLESQDVDSKEEKLLRKQAARMVHQFLRQELGETDEADGSPAYVLADLFDCHICAGHIIQVYVKGIMDGVILADGRQIFATDDMVSEKEAEEIVERVFQKECRRLRSETGNQSRGVSEPQKISLEYALQLVQEEKRALLVDVRTEREYEQDHLENAMNVPLLSIIKNPFVFSENRDTIIMLYCNEEYQSKAAAQCLSEAGYEKVAYFARKEDLSLQNK